MKPVVKIYVPESSEIKAAGHTYCRQDCGFNCTIEAYNAAYEACEAALIQMNEDGLNKDGQWSGNVWDNCGWHWNLVSGGPFGWQLTQSKSGQWECCSYHDVMLPKQVMSGYQVSPIEAIRDCINQINQMIEECKVERKRLTDGIL